MSNSRYSASRFNCFNGCKTNYKHTYIDELVVLGKEVEVQEKGLSMHHIAEQMDSSKSLEDLMKIAEIDLETRNFNKEKYPVIKAIPRFYTFWKEIIEPKEKDGFKIQKEEWLHSAINHKSIVGAIDLLLTNEETKEAIIIDFKTGSTAKIAGYENQLILYAYMIKNQLKTKYDKVKTYLFFPLAALKDEDGTEETARKLMLKTLKEFKFTEDQVKDTIKSFEKIIKETDDTDWENLNLKENSNISYGCSWCAFAGHPTLCPSTYESGVRFSRKWKVIKKQDLKK